jgi:hypothetical protein
VGNFARHFWLQQHTRHLFKNIGLRIFSICTNSRCTEGSENKIGVRKGEEALMEEYGGIGPWISSVWDPAF